MAHRARFMLDLALRAWSAATGRNRRRSGDGMEDVNVHDSDAQKPTDLDNPLHDAGSQKRIGDTIARLMRNAERKLPK